ncbi:MAG TPA: hypothetical protein VGA69_12205 [Nitriliruptorales bacterium]
MEHSPSGSESRSTLAALADSIKAWVKADGKRTVITAAVAFGVAWLANVYLIAVRYEGTQVPPGGAATVSGNRITGVVFWIVLSTVVLTVVGYAQQVGWSRAGAELKVLPRNLAASFQAAEGGLRWAAVLWGAAVSLLVASVFSKAAAGMVGLGVVVVAASPLVGALGRGLRRLGVKVLGMVAPDRAPLLESGQVTIATITGAALGMAIAWQVGPWLPKVVLALAAAAGAAVLLKQGGASAAGATVLLVVLVAASLQELLDMAAYADDGGWQEGGGTLTSWFGSQGSGRVMTQSVLGGLSGATGAIVGSATGSAIASSSSQLAVGGLSGEFAAAEAGVEPAVPGVPVAEADSLRVDEDPTAGPAAGGADPSGAGPSGADPGPDPSGGSGGEPAADDELAIGGLSGEFEGGASDAQGSGGVAPGRSDQGRDDEDRT